MFENRIDILGKQTKISKKINKKTYIYYIVIKFRLTFDFFRIY